MRKKIFITVDATVQFIVKFEVIIYLNIKDECLKFPKINCGIQHRCCRSLVIINKPNHTSGVNAEYYLRLISYHSLRVITALTRRGRVYSRPNLRYGWWSNLSTAGMNKVANRPVCLGLIRKFCGVFNLPKDFSSLTKNIPAYLPPYSYRECPLYRDNECSDKKM